MNIEFKTEPMTNTIKTLLFLCFSLLMIHTTSAGELEDNKAACNKGDARGCGLLGLMYYNGDGVTKDMDAAVRFWKKACVGGIAQGCTNLGEMYRTGDGVVEDMKIAIQYHDKGCSSGNMNSCFNLGAAYQNGDGVVKDKNKAVQYYDKACKSGITISCENSKQLREREQPQAGSFEISSRAIKDGMVYIEGHCGNGGLFTISETKSSGWVGSGPNGGGSEGKWVSPEKLAMKLCK